MTPKQREIFLFISNYTRTHRQSPSLRKIGEGLGLSYITVYGRMKLMQKKGVLEIAGRCAIRLRPHFVSKNKIYLKVDV